MLPSKGSLPHSMPQLWFSSCCSVPEECPAEVEKLLSRCLMADPAVRPNCREIVEVLTKLEDVPAPGRQPSGTSQPSTRQS